MGEVGSSGGIPSLEGFDPSAGVLRAHECNGISNAGFPFLPAGVGPLPKEEEDPDLDPEEDLDEDVPHISEDFTTLPSGSIETHER